MPVTLSATKNEKKNEKGGGLLGPPMKGGGKATVSAGADKKPRLGGGRWRKNAAGQGGRGSMGQRAGGRGQGQGGAPGRPGGGSRPGKRTGARRGSPERQAIHADRQAQRQAGTRPRMGHRQSQMGGGGQPMPPQTPLPQMQALPGMGQMGGGAGWQGMLNQGGMPWQPQPGMSPFGGMLNGGQQNPWGGGPSPQLGSMSMGMGGHMGRMNPYQMR